MTGTQSQTDRTELEQTGDLVYSAYVGKRDGKSGNVHQFRGNALPQVLVYEVDDEYVHVFEDSNERQTESADSVDEWGIKEYLAQQSEANQDTTIGGEVTVDVEEFSLDL